MVLLRSPYISPEGAKDVCRPSGAIVVPRAVPRAPALGYPPSPLRGWYNPSRVHDLPRPPLLPRPRPLRRLRRVAPRRPPPPNLGAVPPALGRPGGTPQTQEGLR